MNRSEVDKNKLSPMMLQYLNIKDKYPDTIIFFRLGDFYEMFFEDAINCSKELELTLTGKNAGLDERVPMCGIPYHAYQGYLDKLIDKGYKVAICEQLTDPKESKGMVERDVIQVVTKGTKLDNLSEKDNNYIGSIYDFDYCYMLSYADISTGEFYVKVTDKESLLRELTVKNIKEVITTNKLDKTLLYLIKTNYNISVTLTDELYQGNDYEHIYENQKDLRIITSIKHLLAYLTNTKKDILNYLQNVIIIDNNEHLIFDIHTKRNLELTETIRTHDRVNSLLWLLDKTKTAPGSRLLKQNIESPLRDKVELERRYDIIEHLLTEFLYKEELITYLDKIYDLERLSSRISYGNLNGRDLIQLRNSLRVLPSIKKVLELLNYDKTIETLSDLTTILDKSINDDPPVTIKEGALIKEGYNKELDELKSIRHNSKQFILELENKEKIRTGIKNLKIGFNKVFGYYIEISNGSKNLVKDEFGYIRKQTLSTGERYITSELKEKEDIILNSEEKIINLEYSLFIEIRDIVRKYISRIQQISKVISEIDMLASFATVTENNNYIRPKLNDSNNILIKDNRHPVIEVVNKSFVPNDFIMNENTNVLLITGPNMAGKSTYMRQLAITSVMAQIGCFVPCKSCEIPIFDKIFTRIGASDDLVSGESTFMVEMLEANIAISNATSKSLILFDELGRGTATYDGMSLAQAILEYIHDEVKCKTLFSTHYHELTKLSKTLTKLKNVHVSAKEEDNKITFLHKVKDGSIDKSYGINVAELANLPEYVIKRSKEILATFENSKKSENNTFIQGSLFDYKEDEPSDKVIKRLKDINPLEITPIEALNILYELKKDLEKK